MNRTSGRIFVAGRVSEARATMLLALMLAVALTQGGCQVQAGKSADKGEADSSKVLPVPVEIETVATGAISARLRLNGVLGTEAEIKVFPLVAGQVERIRVEEGARVRAGDTLLTLEDGEILLSERRLRLEMEKAEQDLGRVRRLSDARMVPEQDLADADYTARRARLSWESARLTVERSRVTAPISGVVGRRLVQVGDMVSAATQLFTLVDDLRLIAVLDVPERELGRLRARQPVLVTAAAAVKGAQAGWIKRISPVVDPASGTVRVTVEVPDPGHQLRAGMYAGFSVVTDTREGVVLVPKRSLVYDRDQTYVWIAGDSTAERRAVTRGYEDEERLEARDGLKPGERLVVVGQSALKPGALIRVVRQDGRDLPQPVERVDAAAKKKAR